MYTKYFLLIVTFILFNHLANAQGCCSGGSGSPIAGNVSQGVLNEHQMEVALSYQYQLSNKFKALDKDTVQLFDKLSSHFLYTRMAYGLTEKLTFSAELGYFLNKTQIGKDKYDTIRSSGVSDLILFPRYQVLNKSTNKNRTEIVLGLGYKIPLGKYNDSMVVYTNPNTGKQQYGYAPPTVQPTTGSQDVIFYGFALRDFTNKKFKLFTNILYIHKGWNALGQKFGNYGSIGLFFNKSFFEKIGLTLQVRGELIGKLKSDDNIDQVALYNIYEASTGSKKIFFTPQLTYTHNNLTYFIMSEIPMYQYLNGTQIASQHQITTGLSYRFFTKQPVCNVE